MCGGVHASQTALFCIISKKSHPHRRISCRTPHVHGLTAFLLPHSTLSPLYFPNRSTPCHPQQGLSFSRLAWTSQKVTRAEFHILEVLNCELASPTPAAWIEIFERRRSLWEEQLQLPHQPNNLAAQPIVLAESAHLIAETSGANSRVSPVLFGSCLLSFGSVWICLLHSNGVTVAHRPIRYILSQFCACCSFDRNGSVSGTFS